MSVAVPLLIGLSGKKRMGKDTVAAQLITSHGFRRFAIADTIKDVSLSINPWIVNTVTGEPARLRDVHEACDGSFEGIKSHPEWDSGVREFLQNMGAVVAGRDPRFWPIPVVHAAREHVLATGNGAVITDIRFPHEVDMIREAGGLVVRVYRSDVPDYMHTDQHISETALDDLNMWRPDALIDTTPLDESFGPRVSDMVKNLCMVKFPDTAGSESTAVSI